MNSPVENFILWGIVAPLYACGGWVRGGQINRIDNNLKKLVAWQQRAAAQVPVPHVAPPEANAAPSAPIAAANTAPAAPDDALFLDALLARLTKKRPQ